MLVAGFLRVNINHFDTIMTGGAVAYLFSV